MDQIDLGWTRQPRDGPDGPRMVQWALGHFSGTIFLVGPMGHWAHTDSGTFICLVHPCVGPGCHKLSHSIRGLWPKKVNQKRDQKHAAAEYI